MRNKKSLAFVSHFAPNGDRSMEEFYLKFSEKLVKEGFDLVHFYSGEPSCNFKKKLSTLKIPYFIFPPVSDFRSAKKLSEIVRKFGSNVLFTSFYSVFCPYMWQIRVTSGVGAWVASDHTSGGIPETSALSRACKKIRGFFVSRLVDYVVCVSDFIRKRDIDGLFLNKDIVVTVHNGIDVKKYMPVKKENGSDVRIAFAGQLIPAKGVDNLLRAVADLPVKAKVVIAGSGPQRSELELLAAKLNLAPEWLGQIDWIPRLFAEADIAVFPSVWEEAFGLVVAEAMACGACVVASDRGGIPEVIGPAGAIFPAGDVQALKHTLEKLIVDKERRISLGNAARDRIVEKFTIETMVNGYHDVIIRVVK